MIWCVKQVGGTPVYAADATDVVGGAALGDAYVSQVGVCLYAEVRGVCVCVRRSARCVRGSFGDACCVTLVVLTPQSSHPHLARTYWKLM